MNAKTKKVVSKTKEIDKTEKTSKPEKISKSKDAIMQKYDIHCHLFNKTFLAKELYYRLIQEIKDLILGDEQKMEKGFGDEIKKRIQKIKNILQSLKRINHFLQIGFKANSTEIYRIIDEAYEGEFIMTPLMFDLTYCFVESTDRTRAAAPLMDMYRELENCSKELFDFTDDITKSYTCKKDQKKLSADILEEKKLLEQLENEKATFIKLTRKWKESTEADVDKRVKLKGDKTFFPNESDGFEEQIEQLKELCAVPEYKNKVYPFLAIDPRRPGILEYMRQNVGKGKPFIGVKLYTPNGYSPTDPILYGINRNDDCVYKFCQENNIPITAHNSNGGFATFINKVKINGDIFVDDKIMHLVNDFYEFNTSLIHNGGKATEERASVLNNPSIWELVIKKYPDLILNLAHFGGAEQLKLALDNPSDETLWSNKLMKLIRNNPNVYTDLSCYADLDALKSLKKSKLFAELKGKILYGSDFYLRILFDDDFDANIQAFKDIFKEDFDIIASINPRKFLANVL